MQTFPSGRASAPREPAALSLEPFRAVRYSPDRVSGIAEVTSPPYDVIGAAAVARLLAADPCNVVRLILPRSDLGQADGGYAEAATTLKEWQADGVLVQDTEPALYAYEQRGAGGQVLQRGLIGGLRLSPPGEGVVLPHEDVMPGPVAGRLALMAAVRANLEPIFLMYDGAPGAAVRLVDEAAGGRPPLLDVATEDGLNHRLWAITDQAELAAIAADLAPRRAVIADGHHRYAAYLELQSRMHAEGAGPGPWDQGLALLVDSTEYPPRIDPIHRVIPGLSPAAAVTAARQAFGVRPVDGGLAAGLDALAEAGRHGPAFLIGDDRQLHLLTEPDPVQVAAAMPAGRTAHWRGLAAAIGQQLLIGRLWGIRDDERTVRVVHHDAAAAVQAAAEAGGTAVLCNPVRAADVAQVAADGERVPRKSTSFGPKPRTGLLMRIFDQP
ncbi:MAG TPA: DUF1015 domain-containing protein [Streptosporangiaceae bacterium]